MSNSCRAWAVAASVATVEALKDPGFCRWNYPLRCLHQRVKSNLKSLAQDAKRMAPQSTSLVANRVRDSSDKMKQSEESLKTVMYLNTWSPS